MKQVIFLAGAVFTLMLGFTSCNNAHNEATKIVKETVR
jgi:hypothetical protein